MPPPTRDDPDLLALLRSTCTMGASILRARGALTGTQREALIADLRSGDEERAKAALPLLGIPQSANEEQRRLVSNFVAQHPLPEVGPARVQTIVENAFAVAKMSFPDGGGPAPDPLDEVIDELDLPTQDEPGGSGDNTAACLAGCQAQAIVLASSAVAIYTGALAACTLAGPLWPVCWAAATAAYALDLYLMDAAIDRCVANCG